MKFYWTIVHKIMRRLERHYTEHVVAEWHRNPPELRGETCDHWCSMCGCVCSHCGRAE